MCSLAFQYVHVAQRQMTITKMITYKLIVVLTKQKQERKTKTKIKNTHPIPSMYTGMHLVLLSCKVMYNHLQN